MTLAWQILGYASGVVCVLMLLGLVGAAMDALKVIAAHRNAQAASVLHHAGLFDTEDEAE